MKVSARLKTGQILKSIKSITCPKKILSIKFPIMPPSINPKLIASIGFFIYLIYLAKITIMIIAMTMNRILAP